MCSAQDVPPYLVYIKGTEKRNVKNAKKMKKDVDIWQNIWYSNTRPKRPGQTSERNPRVSERNQKEIQKKFLTNRAQHDILNKLSLRKTRTAQNLEN